MTDGRTATEEIRMHPAQAATRVKDPDARAHVEAALEAAEALPPPLVEVFFDWLEEIDDVRHSKNPKIETIYKSDN